MDTESWKLSLKKVFSLKELKIVIHKLLLIKFVNCFGKNNNSNKVLAIIVAKFATQWLFAFHFREILLVTLN